MRLHLLCAGTAAADCEQRPQGFEDHGFVVERGGAAVVQRLRRAWHATYDFVPIDHRSSSCRSSRGSAREPSASADAERWQARLAAELAPYGAESEPRRRELVATHG